MITKFDIIKTAHEHGFEDIGFTTAVRFQSISNYFWTGVKSMNGHLWEKLSVLFQQGSPRGGAEPFPLPSLSTLLLNPVWAIGNIGGPEAFTVLEDCQGNKRETL